MSGGGGAGWAGGAGGGAEGLLGGEKYSLTARAVNASANEQVKAWNQFNSDAPAG